uniref:Antibiotic biosynthesis monooxygenase n=1 Tax=Streptomyces sp. SoC090715LN-16 TaxID=1898658 RepID=A0A3B8GS87_9ACTN|nr:antibiotic biosynthesis monooxygenase [Streptomyces sp. SoC090715LN-16]
MATISAEKDYFTTINVFTTTPEHQQKVLEIISGAEEKMRDFPGFVSASIHVSHDGTQVIGYAQWAKKEDFDGMRARADLQQHFQAVRKLVSSVDPIAARVTYTHDGT